MDSDLEVLGRAFPERVLPIATEVALDDMAAVELNEDNKRSAILSRGYVDQQWLDVQLQG